jgi:hypothetical protein
MKKGNCGRYRRRSQQPIWSARTCPRFETGRHVSQSESGAESPQSKFPVSILRLRISDSSVFRHSEPWQNAGRAAFIPRWTRGTVLADGQYGALRQQCPTLIDSPPRRLTSLKLRRTGRRSQASDFRPPSQVPAYSNPCHRGLPPALDPRPSTLSQLFE